MKKTDSNKYPHSATLFQFCKQALMIKYQGNVKVIDQDVGGILGYDPADCSHWKKGKKNVKSLPTIKTIADYLGVDEKLIIDITCGKMDLQEALFEYRGYGDFAVSQNYLDGMKKEYFRNPQKWGNKNNNGKSFEELFDVRRPWIEGSVDALFADATIAEAPVYLPEVISKFSDVTLKPDADQSEDVKLTVEGDQFIISYIHADMKPYVRFLIAKELAKILLFKDNPSFSGNWQKPTTIENIQCNIGAASILIPSHILRKEVEQLDISMDIVNQLAELFWVSKGLINNRLKDFLVSRK